MVLSKLAVKTVQLHSCYVIANNFKEEAFSTVSHSVPSFSALKELTCIVSKLQREVQTSLFATKMINFQPYCNSVQLASLRLKRTQYQVPICGSFSFCRQSTSQSSLSNTDKNQHQRKSFITLYQCLSKLLLCWLYIPLRQLMD